MTFGDPLSRRNLLRIATTGKAYQVSVIRHQLKPFYDDATELTDLDRRLVEEIVEALARAEGALEDLHHRLAKPEGS